ncbi:MAG TPA: GNAT family N-acetyltransferase [Candidatus Cloacimonadota bacterium]|nr:GNAT family N-acetyltransferase [Candidatus Cloacimonadota bacterium]
MITYEQLIHAPSAEDLEQLRQLYLSNGWLEASATQTGQVITSIITHTFCFAVARDDGKIIGMGRSISDGVSDAYIQDVTVLPQYRKRGIGGGLIQFLVDFLHAQGINWIGLISEPGYENFYREQGFAVMPGYTPFLYVGKKKTDKV